ncbi:MAG: adenine phosphoribosyltransferase [Bacteroidetes bacterium]|nr:adenine phosphoribosyltransferase [Bacteroidota bacterium]
MTQEEKIKSSIRDVPDFPKKGIVFKDITPILKDSKLCTEIANGFIKQLKGKKIDAIVSTESRGFFFGFLLANKMGIPLIPLRKPGKLPYKTISHEYELEYGKAKVEMHVDALKKNWRVLIHDDLLATGGTAEASAVLVQRQNAKVAGFAFVVELGFLGGRKKLERYSDNIISLVRYG